MPSRRLRRLYAPLVRWISEDETNLHVHLQMNVNVAEFQMNPMFLTLPHIKKVCYFDAYMCAKSMSPVLTQYTCAIMEVCYVSTCASWLSVSKLHMHMSWNRYVVFKCAVWNMSKHAIDTYAQSIRTYIHIRIIHTYTITHIYTYRHVHDRITKVPVQLQYNYYSLYPHKNVATIL